MSTRLGPRAWLAIASVTVSACGSPTGPSAFSVVVTPWVERDVVARFSAAVSGQSLTIEGWIGLPEPCYDFSGRAAVAAAIIDVTLVATRNRFHICQQSIAQVPYTIVVGPVPRGEWQLRVSNEEVRVDRTIIDNVFNAVVVVQASASRK